MDDSKKEWRALRLQVIKVDRENESNWKEFQMVMNTIKEAIVGNSHMFTADYERTHTQIDCYHNDHSILRGQIKELEGTVHLQKSTIDQVLDKVTSLEETVETLVLVVTKLKMSICHCQDHLLLLGPHYVKGVQGEVVVDSEEEDDEGEDGLKYGAEVETLDPSYTTPPSTGGCTPPSPHPSCSPTPEGSDPENNAHLQMLIEACVEVFLAEADKDLELHGLPPFTGGVRATLPPSTLFADRALLHREYSISEPNT